MDLLTPARLTALMETRAGVHISLYMPTHRRGAATQQNPVRYTNLLRQAEGRLYESGLRAAEVHAVLESSEELLADNAFWQHQSDGLALFIAPQIFRAYRLPLAFEELVVVSTRFHTKPLLSLLSGDGRFYVLALSQNAVRMLQCTRYHVSEVELDGVPTSLAELGLRSLSSDQLQVHPGPRWGGGKRTATLHGQGTPDETIKEHLLTYCRHIDKGLHKVLKDESAPLVLAGVGSLLSRYREANTYAYLVHDAVTGNPDDQQPETLREQAWRIVQPLFRQAQDEAVARYKALAGTGRTSHELSAVVAAAYQGRVDTLFVTLGTAQWGRFDPETQVVQVEQDMASGVDDLLDVAAMHTYFQRGTVYAMAPAEMPDSAPIAAVLRY